MLGTPAQGKPYSDFIYDTGSGFLTVNSVDCPSCSSAYYDPKLSRTSKKGFPGYLTITELHYGSASLYGEMYTDDVCLYSMIEESCVKGLGFFLV